MELWPSDMGAEFPIQGSWSENHCVAPRSAIFYPSEVYEMSTRGSWGLSGNK